LLLRPRLLCIVPPSQLPYPLLLFLDTMADVNARRRIIVLKIEATVDILCPWPYMQKKALDKAIARYQQRNPDVSFDVVWKPFYVNAELEGGTSFSLSFLPSPTLPGRDALLLTVCFASEDIDIDKSSLYTGNMESRDNWDRLMLAGPKYNIRFNHNGRTGPSRDAHKLLHAALWEHGSEGQSKVIDALFKGHFEEGRDISDRVWLVQVGTAAGITELVCDDAVKSEKLGCMVDDAVAAAMSDGKIKASPSVMIGSTVIRDKSYRIGGFQAEPVLEDAFQRMYEADAAVTLPNYSQLVASIPAS
jgi:predicted DsbA family dithiol-disulfide isomerase